MSKAVSEIIDLAVKTFIDDNTNLAKTIEPLEQVIDNLKLELSRRQTKRIEQGECSIENGMLFFDIINSFERIADHCSNLAVCIIELSNRTYQTHSYLSNVKHNSQGFMKKFEEYLVKYKIN
jgi:phosphate:Na+ symporter